MPLFLNTDKAPKLFRCEDLFVVATLTAVHEVMVFTPARELRPTTPFDLLLFYCTLVEGVARHLRYSPAAVLPACEAPAPANIPDFGSPAFRDAFFVTSGIAPAYLELLQQRADDDGVPFDVSYAATIAALALEADALVRIENAKGKRYVQTDSLDDWLSGFNAP